MYTKETSPIYTQEDLDRLIEQRRELDDKIDEVEAYIRQESVGKLEDEYRKLLVGKILVSTNDWGLGGGYRRDACIGGIVHSTRAGRVSGA